MKKTTSALLATLVLSTSPMAFANEKTLDSVLDVEATMQASATWSEADDYEETLRLVESNLTFTAQISENIKVVVAAKLDRMFREAGVDQTDDFDLEEFVRHAYVRIDEMAGQPVAVIVGKKQMNYSAQLSQFLAYYNNPTHADTFIDEVFGLTVTLDSEDIGNIEASIFENLENAGDLDMDFGDVESFAVKWSKHISDAFVATAGYAHLQSDAADADNKLSVGVVYATEDGTQLYAQGLMTIEGDENIEDAEWSVEVGAAKDIEVGQVVGSITFIDEYMTQIAAGINVEVASGMLIGPEIRFNMYDDSTGKDNETVYGLGGQLTLGNDDKMN